jgi:hypothetical protein
MKKYHFVKGLLAMTIILCLSVIPVFAQDEPGDLWLVDVESVSPSNVADYIQWGKDFKSIADETNFETFFVARENNDFSYAWNIGKSYSGLDEFDKKFTEWAKANPKVGESYTKYAHTLNTRTRYLWRHLPKYSYTVEGYDGSGDTYVRLYRAWIQEGKWSEAMEIMEGYLKVWQDAGISNPYSVFRNEFGMDSNCIAFRQTFKDTAAWAASEKEFEEKAVGEQLQALFTKWAAVIIKSEDVENWINSDLTHIASN